MATITGTSADESLTGTDADDVIISGGGDDFLSGGDGADQYVLTQGAGASFITIDDAGSDGAVDTITGGRQLYTSASLGYSAWATAERVGDDFVLHLPGKPYRFHQTSWGTLDITIKDHFAGNAVEFIELSAGFGSAPATFRLLEGLKGTDGNDIFAGTAGDETVYTYDGDDFIDLGEGRDTVYSGRGDDVVFGDGGRDIIVTGAGDDTAYGGTGNDVIKTNTGNDWLEGGDGKDMLVGGAGNDIIYAGTGNDTLKGQRGWDRLTGGDGDDMLIGGREGDTYVFGYDRATLGTTDQWGHDTILDNGNRAKFDASVGKVSNDVLEFYGLYGPSSGNMNEAIAKIETARVGDDMVISTMDGLSSVTVQNQFMVDTHQYYIESVVFDGAYWEPYSFSVVSAEHINIGDDRGGKSVLNEFMFGTAGDDTIFSDTGYDLIWTGAGADTLLYKQSDPVPFTYSSANAVYDTVMDFDVTSDRLDFTQIAGFTFSDLTISSDAEGDAAIAWLSGDVAIASIFIELRGVAAADVTEDIFVFNTPAPVAPPPTPAPPGGAITGTDGADVLVGTDYADRFLFTADTAFLAVDTVKDYIVDHGDMLDVSDLLVGFDPATDAITDFVHITPDPESDDVTLSVDRDGTGGAYSFQDIAVIIDGASLDVQTLYDDGLLIA